MTVTCGVIRAAQKEGVDRELALRSLSDKDLDAYVRQKMYDPFNEGEKIDAEIRDLTSNLPRL